MGIKFSRKAKDFLLTLEEGRRETLRKKLLVLSKSLTEHQIIPFQELQIKKLKGPWEGFYRLRHGNIRVLFRIEEPAEIYIYDIRFRGGAYRR